MIEANALTVAGRLAVVSAAFAPGRITAICGPNGAGKSTLLQCMAGLIEPQRGAVRLDGAPLPHGRERARRIGHHRDDVRAGREARRREPVLAVGRRGLADVLRNEYLPA